MSILGISGSPKKGGNNEQIIDFVLKIAKKKKFSVDKIFLSKYNIRPCKACDFCKKKKDCSIKDDDIRKIIPKLESADAIIISSPVYFGGVSSQLKSLFDRSIILRRNKFQLKDKIGAAIAAAKCRNGGQEYTIQNIHTWMHIHGMIVVGDNNHFGGTVVVPFAEDEFGKSTVKETVNKVLHTLEILKE